MSMNDKPLHTMTCCIKPETAALERILQVVRKRGFSVERFTAEHDKGRLRIRLSCSGSRCPDMLRAQLDKLHGVQSVCLLPGASTASNDRLSAVMPAQSAV
ncbi:ACT domain-containing protein [Salinisphaera sp. T5B8]|uniref:ACT domain-containing protein n=1 Tax=Salinisphaera sp. T5B8 TaxID=1304154 RepID=UPI00333E618B